ncbi:NRAMP (natural resistance-associated macrophage protein)-like metal ion transporter [Caulobacter ginsengisoli]|uniref:NRAMP (Natural resistance-associated macrophage protein)-like metal ion transporter n=1 Tax=Caulobacter ginsengisoli TaxID=400775 RepID=A0ABU0ISM1_9CAUL|nr:divalent metal cation transporter [Caulobacter ginsengisoli]MDQ0464356.1 NRAMP (natural resistance-associated macrophage protein)-like metal ion transporter [Caulobacter ginsengisoli]
MPTLRRRVRSIALIEQLGPGLITGAADDDPSGIATYSQAGARFGFAMLWTLVLTYPLMCAIQLVSAHIGRVTGQGLARNLGQLLHPRAVTLLVGLLFVANTINIGADLAAMGEAAELATGLNNHGWTIGFAVVSLLLQLFIPYRRYARALKWLTLVLLSYVAVLFMVELDWPAAGAALIKPGGPWTAEALTMIVAIFGTTISPYLFFWQSSQEVEEMGQDPNARPLNQAPDQARGAFARMRLDTFVGMAASNLIALAVMLSTAATLHASGKDIQTAADAAEALRPVAGPFAFALFSLGIVGTGLLAVPVLAGSAAYAVGETRGWKTGLDRKPWEAAGFYLIIALATLLGVGIDWSPLDPIKALFWSAVINGVIAVPIMACMMIVVGRHKAMGRFAATLPLKLLGWTATLVMAAAVAAMGWAMVTGQG